MFISDKNVFRGGQLKMSASKNKIFLEAVVLKCPPKINFSKTEKRNCLHK